MVWDCQAAVERRKAEGDNGLRSSPKRVKGKILLRLMQFLWADQKHQQS